MSSQPRSALSRFVSYFQIVILNIFTFINVFMSLLQVCTSHIYLFKLRKRLSYFVVYFYQGKLPFLANATEVLPWLGITHFWVQDSFRFFCIKISVLQTPSCAIHYTYFFNWLLLKYDPSTITIQPQRGIMSNLNLTTIASVAYHKNKNK